MSRKQRELLTEEAKKQAEIDAAWEQYHALQKLGHPDWLEQHLLRQGGRCHYCNTVLMKTGSESDRDRRPTLDHVIPRSKGGEDRFANTVAACQACNTAKSDLDEALFRLHPVRLARLKIANTPPDRLSIEPQSPFYDASALDRSVGVRFNGKERNDVREYSVSQGWVLVPAGKTLDRTGRPLAVKLKGVVEPYFRS